MCAEVQLTVEIEAPPVAVCAEVQLTVETEAPPMAVCVLRYN